MNFQKFLAPLLGVVLIVGAWTAAGWGGVALVAGGILMWVLLHFNRMMTALRRAADRPIGYVDSAVMLTAKLQAGVTLLHVVTMTRSLGELQSPKDRQPEIYRWTDNSDSHVTCEFNGGKLVKWKLERPAAPDDASGSPASSTDN